MFSTTFARAILIILFGVSVHSIGYTQEKSFLLQVHDSERHPTLDSLEKGLMNDRIYRNHSHLAASAPDISIERVFRYAGKHEAKHRKYGLDRWYRIAYDASVVDSVVVKRVLAREGRMERAETAHADVANGPNDSLFYKQWNFHNTGQNHGRSGADISLINAMRMEQGKPQVVISIHDSGLDFSHADLTHNLWTNPGEIAGNEIDDDDNGYVDDVHGWNFQAMTNNLQDTDGHGTHVAGVIASKANASGVTGIAGGNSEDSGVRLMICRLDDDAPGLRIIRPWDSIIYAADNGAIISQNSWNTFGFSLEVRIAINYFANEAKNEMMNGGLVVFSAGNNGSVEHRYESDSPNVMMVGNTNHQDVLSHSSNFGIWLAICAPGTDIFSNHLNGGWKHLSGTSMAAPHVSGVAGLVVSKFGHHNYTPDSAIMRIRGGADNIDAYNLGKLGMLGSGRLNAFRSLVDNDSLGPAQIDSIYIGKIRSQDVSLKWIAPRDSLFSAFKYEVKYSNAGIDSIKRFYVRLPNAGDTIRFAINDLAPDTEYKISITAFDYFGNPSSESSPVNFKTTGKPTISVSSFNPVHNIHRDSSYVTSFEINNSGEGELDWYVSGSHPDSLPMKGVSMKVLNYWTYYEAATNAASLGAVTSELIPPVRELEVEGKHLIVLDDQIRIMDSLELVTIANWVARGGSLVMMADSRTELQKANVLGKLLGVRVQAYPEERTFSIEPQNIRHVLLDEVLKLNIRECGTYLVPEHGNSFGALEPVLYDIDNNVHMVAGKFGKGKIVFVANRFLQSYGISDFDNFRLARNVIHWLGDNNVLRFEKQNGSILPGQSKTVKMSFSHTLKNPFNGTLYVTSNDLDDPLTELAYAIDFKGTAIVKLPQMLLMDTTFTRYEVSREFIVRNIGSDTLYASVVTDDLNFYSKEQQIVLPHGQSDTLTIYFDPMFAGTHSAMLSIESNEVQLANMPISGFAFDPPVAHIFPVDTLKVYVPHGSTAHRRIYIDNLTGNSQLQLSDVTVKRTGVYAEESASIEFSNKKIALSNPGIYDGTISRIEWGSNTFMSLSPTSDFQDADLIMLDLMVNELDHQKISEIRQWIQNGGRLLMQLDQIATNEKLAELFSGTTFKSVGKYSPSYHDTIAISSLHPVTEGTTEFKLRNVETYFNVDDSFHALIKDRFDNTLLAWETFGQGKIVIASGRLLSNENPEFQNVNLVTQCFNWLLRDDPYWLTIGEVEKTVSPGSSVSLPLTFQNTSNRDRLGKITFRTNDPARPLAEVNIKMLTSDHGSNENHPPQIVNLSGLITIHENPSIDQYIFKGQALDHDGDELHWFTEASFVHLSGLGVVTVIDSAYFDFETSPVIPFELSVTDGVDTVSASSNLVVLNVNESPWLALLETHSMQEDETYEVEIFAADPEGENVALNLKVEENNIFDNAQIELNGNKLKFSPDANEAGQVKFKVSASDGVSSDSLECILNVIPVNDPPEFSALIDQSIVQGELFTVQFSARDVDNNVLQIKINPTDEFIFLGESFEVQKSGEEVEIVRSFVLKNNGNTQVTVSVADEEDTISGSFMLDVSTITGTSPESRGQRSVYPNPASFYLNVISDPEASNISVEFIDALGRIVKTSFELEKTGNEIFVGDLSAGVYILRITDNKKQNHMEKITIQH